MRDTQNHSWGSHWERPRLSAQMSPCVHINSWVSLQVCEHEISTFTLNTVKTVTLAFTDAYQHLQVAIRYLQSEPLAISICISFFNLNSFLAVFTFWKSLVFSPLCNWCFFFFYRGPNYLFMLSIRQLILSQSKDGDMNGVRNEVRSH